MNRSELVIDEKYRLPNGKLVTLVAFSRRYPTHAIVEECDSIGIAVGTIAAELLEKPLPPHYEAEVQRITEVLESVAAVTTTEAHGLALKLHKAGLGFVDEDDR